MCAASMCPHQLRMLEGRLEEARAERTSAYAGLGYLLVSRVECFPVLRAYIACLACVRHRQCCDPRAS